MYRSDLLVVATEGGAEYQAYYYPASGFGAVVTNKWGGSEQKTNTSYFRLETILSDTASFIGNFVLDLFLSP